jgi:hypothetical protein
VAGTVSGERASCAPRTSEPSARSPAPGPHAELAAGARPPPRTGQPTPASPRETSMAGSWYAYGGPPSPRPGPGSPVERLAKALRSVGQRKTFANRIYPRLDHNPVKTQRAMGISTSTAPWRTSASSRTRSARRFRRADGSPSWRGGPARPLPQEVEVRVLEDRRVGVKLPDGQFDVIPRHMG